MKTKIKIVVTLAVILALIGLVIIFNQKNKIGEEIISGLSSPERVLLTKHNTVILRGEVNEQSSSLTIRWLLLLSSNLPAGEPIFLVLNSQGGSLKWGMQIVEAINSLGREVKTISIRSSSMAFFLAQYAGERLILPSGTMMIHQPYLWVEGYIRSTLLENLRSHTRWVQLIETKVSERIGLSLKEYEKLAQNEFNVEGQDAVDRNMADRVVFIECDSALQNGQLRMVEKDDIGPFMAIYSTCPLVHSMIGREELQTTGNQ